MKTLASYQDPFQAVKEFETGLQSYTGAPYVIVTDCCTHAMEICLRIKKPRRLAFTAHTYLSVVMLMHKLGINYELTDEAWYDQHCYQLHGSNIWDCARDLRAGMYMPGQIQCLSFNRGKPLAIGKGGAILTDDADLAAKANRMRYDGRDIFSYKKWTDQQDFELGFHYYLRPEECIAGINMLEQQQISLQTPEHFQYYDCRLVKIKNT